MNSYAKQTNLLIDDEIVTFKYLYNVVLIKFHKMTITIFG